MLSSISKRLTYTNVAVTVALVFAMSGGAYAASKYVITSTKQISPKVLKSLKGANGSNGANGATGAQGAAGPQGAVGAPGLPGKEGPEGKEGKEGPIGKPGKEGKEGSPWTAGGVLPSEATETGFVFAETVSPTSNIGVATLSFPIRLKELQTHFTFVTEEEVEKNEVPSSCAGGTLEKPAAKPGWLCMFGNGGAVKKEGLIKLIQGAASTTTGMAFEVETANEGEFFHISWAVTAE